MPETPLEANLKKESRFKQQYNDALNCFFTKVLAGVTGISYAPEICVIPQLHSDHLPHLRVLENRLDAQKRDLTVYIPVLNGNKTLFAGVLKRYHAKLLGKGREEVERSFGSDLQARLAELQREFDRIKIETCGRTVQYDGIKIEFLETYESPSLRYPGPSLAMSMLLEEDKRIPVCLESEENQIAYIGEAATPPEKIYEILTELNPESGEVILTPPHPEYDKDIIQNGRIAWSAEAIDAERQKTTTNYTYTSQEIRDLVASIEREKDITLSISLDPCHAEGVLNKPDLSVLIQTIPCLVKSLFIEKDERGKYVFDNSSHHYLARLVKHHYKLPSIDSKAI